MSGLHLDSLHPRSSDLVRTVTNVSTTDLSTHGPPVVRPPEGVPA
jgi:hypothetical protein